MYEFSQHEYDQHLTDPDWTAHETQYLFALLKSFDCRFVIVADRYAYPGKRGELLAPQAAAEPGSTSAKGKEKEATGGGGSSSSSMSGSGRQAGLSTTAAGLEGGRKRSIEDIKSRYYSVCRRLVRSRPTGDEFGKTQMLQYYAFDKGPSLRSLAASGWSVCYERRPC